MNNYINFDQTDRSAIISIDELKRTMPISDAFGELPKQIPVPPGDLLNTFKEKIQKYTGLNAIERPIVIREQYCQSNGNKKKNKEPLLLEDYMIRRFVTKLEVSHVNFKGTNDQMRPAIALSYCMNDGVKGIQVSFGENVSVCDNLTCFGNYRFGTFGSEKVGFEEGMQLLDHWLQNFEQVDKDHVDAVNYLRNIEVSKKEYQRIIGSLFEKAIRFNNGDRNVIAPLDQTQVAMMVREGIKILNSDTEELDVPFTAWDLLNWGTFTFKANKSDMIDIIQTNSQFNNYILSEFDYKMPSISL